MFGGRQKRKTHDALILWYKQAIIYQLHVRAFFDSTMTASAISSGWRRSSTTYAISGPIRSGCCRSIQSPLRDDGYDISDYKAVHPAYGTLDDFRDFVEQAHARGMRVIIELVVNHSSDQHPWFQRARRAPPGSPERDFYVWSETGREFEDARIIFLDFGIVELDLGPGSQGVLLAPLLRLAARPQFRQSAGRPRDQGHSEFLARSRGGRVSPRCGSLSGRARGTNSENLAETHSILKLIRAEVERRRPDCLLLAEANQCPEDTLPYFGSGDECHMAFHFPLMPRLFMAMAQEDSAPIIDIIERTRDLPEGCQWALFLRNHDELTLEMVTRGRAAVSLGSVCDHRRLRINLGIRRRLATLLNGDRRRVELLNSLLFSLNGTPIVYYGDEIGMGDNPFLGDRDGVRTPMQWSADRNAGFSRADEVALYLPPISDRRFGYEAVNVESSARCARRC